jgi:transposase
MDNASFHHTERIEQMCANAEVKLVYLPPYSPNLNPIEEFFAELKASIKQKWKAYEDSPEQGFNAFLEWYVDVVGERGSSAKGYCRHIGSNLLATNYLHVQAQK